MVGHCAEIFENRNSKNYPQNVNKVFHTNHNFVQNKESHPIETSVIMLNIGLYSEFVYLLSQMLLSAQLKVLKIEIS